LSRESKRSVFLLTALSTATNLNRISKQGLQESTSSQLGSSSNTQKERVRSLTVESDHDFIQQERTNTVNALQEEYSLRKSTLEIRQKERDLKEQPLQESG
jgi:hypothetical protein